MAANRKLLAEIQQVLKKVEEGVLVFDEVWEKVYSAPQQTLKEKYEADLKKEIKKLQRLRDQIKAWIGSNEVKDKNGLVEARKTIESKMEQFKICEKDTKTKAFSKEGLAREAKLDPKEALKVEKIAWVNDCLEKLADIINSDEADKEKLVNAKGKAKNKEQIEKYDNRLLKHKWHETRLELIIKLVENDELDPALLEGIKDSLEYYLESATDDDGASNPEDEFDIYEDLQLDTIVPESELAVKKDAHDEEVSASTKEEVAAAAVSAAASAAPVSAVKIPAGAAAASKGAAAATAAAPAKATPAVAASTPSKAAPAAATAAAATAVPAPAVAGAKTAASVVAASAAAPPTLTAAAKPTAAAVAAGTVKPTEAKKSLASIVAASAAAEDHSKDAAESHGPTTAAAPTPAPGLSWATAAAKVAGAAPAAAPAAATTNAPPPPVLVASQPTPASLPSMTPAPPTLVKPATAAAPATPAASAATPAATAAVPPPPLSSATAAAATPAAVAQTPAPPALNPAPATAGGGSVTSTPLIGSASPALSAAATPTAMPPPLQQKVNPEMMLTLNMLKASMLLTPESLEPEKAPSYTPRNFYQHGHPSYPAIPLFSTHAENSAWFERLPMDTLFFVFYFQQGTYQQYLAAKQLKKHSWRFHKKYMTWFQRHEEPKIATEEYEEGTYVYFDYESGWCQRIKSEFKFEYAYLEDELTSSLDG